MLDSGSCDHGDYGRTEGILKCLEEGLNFGILANFLPESLQECRKEHTADGSCQRSGNSGNAGAYKGCGIDCDRAGVIWGNGDQIRKFGLESQG